MDELSLTIMLTIFAVAIVVTVIVIVVKYCKSPFVFPYCQLDFDVTGKKLPNVEDYIDDYIIKYKMVLFNMHLKKYKEWKEQCKIIIEKSPFKKKRQKQYYECLDENHMFIFVMYRRQTRYQQHNYVKNAFMVRNDVSKTGVSYAYLASRYNQLKQINFETNLSTYHSKEQRKSMTKELREQIAIRDNYTCQMCGKYMPDKVGLHIDHIIPVSKGGKSVPSNLRVLCSICNGKKSNK